ncbi:cytochrome c1 heme lyase-like protein [Lophium mytilinum]|uniref:Holocytochrome c-type synthase n=1 Tax=Lophium mytilinum TaxID=390894 RepID=A0A6A6QFK1_9PEZI|nr:cytochrome c1 heme lyase-like protein [Lophium mytilinum]
MANETEAAPDACPVDPTTREAWLAQAKKAGQQAPHPHPAATAPSPSPSPLVAQSCDSSEIDKSPAQSQSYVSRLWSGLGTDREVSTIPRTVPDQAATKLANNEQETGADKKSGNWIYPSEQMFFNAMKRKNFDPEATDMKSIVPIHNAVNERAWGEIKDWEKGRGADACGGPRLESFSGLSSALTPKARINTWMGYQPPFDRHDWVVDRCGKKIEYVIDFYAGKDENQGRALNFYLDVRPKLNSFEGWKMRALKTFGL